MVGGSAATARSTTGLGAKPPVAAYVEVWVVSDGAATAGFPTGPRAKLSVAAYVESWVISGSAATARSPTRLGTKPPVAAYVELWVVSDGAATPRFPAGLRSKLPVAAYVEFKVVGTTSWKGKRVTEMVSQVTILGYAQARYYRCHNNIYSQVYMLIQRSFLPRTYFTISYFLEHLQTCEQPFLHTLSKSVIQATLNSTVACLVYCMHSTSLWSCVKTLPSLRNRMYSKCTLSGIANITYL